MFRGFPAVGMHICVWPSGNSCPSRSVLSVLIRNAPSRSLSLCVLSKESGDNSESENKERRKKGSSYRATRHQKDAGKKRTTDTHREGKSAINSRLLCGAPFAPVLEACSQEN
mmetsp:Transcript_26310/g.51705  ORF Transcript_26310/g.51705 Transcript_26310/m.51705 type:complete len:113 (-) Transcript_26310:888-1226(-)